MKKTIALISLSLGLTLGHPSLLYGAGEPLVQVQPRNNSLGVDEQLWQMYGTVGDRGNLIKSIDH
ncbi:MAG: murein transglycosylase, partial [Prochloron sp. SP5CPC1]|nr:murein transglycosylase [Candidatus Paraprochloron terpiosi SP5CPC1]